MGKFLIWILAEDVVATTIAPFGIYIRGEASFNTINHEMIHWKQQAEMLFLFFYLWYGFEWLVRRIKSKEAYYKISFEKEAYSNDNDDSYLLTRKHFSWRKYL